MNYRGKNLETLFPRQRDDKTSNEINKSSEDLARSLLYEAQHNYTRWHENSLLAEYILSQD